MKTKDYLVVALAPLLVLLIPLVGIMVSEEWKWTWSDFVVAWVLLAGTTFLYRLLATRKAANFAYRAGAGLAVAAGFLLTWVNLAVQIVGDDGVLQTRLGFETQADAEGWIIEDARTTVSDDPRFRMRWRL